jgi:CRP/FNR family transcriptional regulator
MTAMKEHEIAVKRPKSNAFFKSLTLFSNLSEKDIALFANAAQIRSYQKGQLLYLEGDKAKYFHVICNGWVKLFHTTDEGEEVVLAMLTTNSITGEHSIFEEGNFTSSAMIVESAQILSIPLSLLKEQMRQNNQLAFNMLTSMVQYQRSHELQLERYLLYTAPQRIGCFLLGLCPVLEQKDGVILNLPYDKTLIASTLGMKGATFSRALNILRDETGIHITGTRVTIDSMEKLLTFVNGCYTPTDIRALTKP